MRQKKDSNAIINRLEIKLVEKSRLSIPLRRMIPLLQVRPINELDVERLENEFVTGYRDGDRSIYVSIFNNQSQTVDVTNHLSSSWSALWKDASKSFVAFLAKDGDLAHMVGKMFFVWEGNHKLTAWWRHVNNFHGSVKAWHIAPHCIICDPRGEVGIFLNVMNDVN